MPFEYAASFPREAEQSLAWIRQRAFRYIGLKDRKKLIKGIGINSKPSGEGYHWEISIDPELKQELRGKAQNAVLRKIPPDLLSQQDWIAKFAEYVALENNNLEWCTGFSSDGQRIFELWDNNKVHPIQSVSPALTSAFEEYILAQRFL